MSLVYGSVCSGIEAATVAWEPLGWQAKFFSEIEKFPSAVLAHHYGSNMPDEPLSKNGIPNYGDFTKIPADAGPVDVLVGGTPCQSFSIAGKRLGLDDPRGNLALKYLSLARRLRARWIVWENVPGVLSSVSNEADGEAGVRSGTGEAKAGDEWIEESDFATFLQFVQECGYGFAYRVLDAQYVRVDGYERAVPQRRRRVFVVGYLGDWRRAAAVLLEPSGMLRNPPPRRQPGQRSSPTISARTSGGGGLGTDFELDGGLISSEEDRVAPTIKRDYGKGYSDGELSGGLVAFGGGNTSDKPRSVSAALTAKDYGADADAEVSPTLRAGSHDTSHANAGNPPAIAFDWYASESQSLPIDEGLSPPLKTTMQPAVQNGWAVRRLTPRECERLQGFPDDYTQIPNWDGWREVGKDEDIEELKAAGLTIKPSKNGLRVNDPDGVRYKALGNSMACNVMRWIGWRIDHFEKLVAEGKIPR